MLPQVREWLDELSRLRQDFESKDRRIADLTSRGTDVGGQLAGSWVARLVEMKTVLEEFARHQIELKDPERGLVDFPAVRDGREVFLCWETAESDIAHWHELDAGYAGRKRL